MPVYSHSKLETFKTCPLKYKYRYIDKIEKPDEQSIEAFVGSRVHEALRKLYEDLQTGRLNRVAHLVEFYNAEWNAKYGPGIKIVRAGTNQSDYHRYGERCIRNYYAQYAPFDQSETLHIEEHFLFDLDPSGQLKLQGYMDRVARRPDGAFEIHDYKTGRSVPTQQHADVDGQLGLYQIALQSQRPEARRVVLLWHYLGHSRTLRSARRPEQLVQLRESTTAVIHRIELTKDFPPHKSPLCDWCEYKPECPLWGGSPPARSK